MQLFSFSQFCQTVSRMVVPNYIPTSKVTVLIALLFLSVLRIVSLFNFNPFSWMYNRMSLSLNLHLPDDQWGWTPFPMFIGHLDILFSEVPIQVFCSFLNCVVSFSYWLVGVLYIFWIWVLWFYILYFLVLHTSTFHFSWCPLINRRF